ncbi:calcium-binding protein [Shimia sp. R10_1]|uniref:calcium-binding protein n=1 Tax=Shimia sp. R10_1 TaxID=2821095 RepID=UPI001ADC012D|nr:calcium-binding protein [Shimia sp. R10_1]
MNALDAIAEDAYNGYLPKNAHNGDYVSPQSPETPNNPSESRDPGDSGDKDPWNGNDSGSGSGNSLGHETDQGSTGTTTGDDWSPSGGEWHGGNGDQSHGTPDPSLPDNPDYSGVQPVVIDLDFDGVELAFGNPIYFDWDDDGYKEQATWAAADDGFLVLDLNADGSRGGGDGKIDQAREIAFSLWGNTSDTDLQALGRAFDLNRDGVLNASDAVWSELRIWQDLDQDAVTDDGELKTLADWGITEINLTYDNGAAFDDREDDITVFGSTLAGLASYTREGVVVEGGVGDLELAYTEHGWKRVETADGYSIEFETGEEYRFVELEGTASTDVDLTTNAISGVSGNAGDNRLDATDFTRNVQITGADGNDTLLGGAKDDFLSGGAGVDRLAGRSGNDVLFVDRDDLTDGYVSGGDGIDAVYIEDTSGVRLDLTTHTLEIAVGGEGDDTITVNDTGAANGDFDARVSGGGGDDTLAGHDGDDELSGDEGNDLLYGRGGDDVVFGGDGHDTVSGSNGDDYISGGAGNDRIFAGSDDDFVQAGDGNDRLFGEEGDDRLYGGEGNDSLDGGKHDDVVYGGAGDDTLTFWRGDDLYSGGSGDDTFELRRSDQYDASSSQRGWAVTAWRPQKMSWLWGTTCSMVLTAMTHSLVAQETMC